MNDKEKQKEIVEMANKLDELFIPHIGYTNDFMRLDIAQELLKYYQPKLLENSVILSKEEYNQLVNIKKFSETTDRSLRVGNLLVYLEEFKEEVRKETAKSLLSELVYVTKIFHGDNSNILVWVEEKVKQFGVDMKSV